MNILKRKKMISNNLILHIIQDYTYFLKEYNKPVLTGTLSKEYLLAHKKIYTDTINKLTQKDIDEFLLKPLALVYFYIDLRKMFLLHIYKNEHYFLFWPELETQFFDELKPIKDGVINLYTGEISWINKKTKSYKLKVMCEIDLRQDKKVERINHNEWHRNFQGIDFTQKIYTNPSFMILKVKGVDL